MSDTSDLTTKDNPFNTVESRETTRLAVPFLHIHSRMSAGSIFGERGEEVRMLRLGISEQYIFIGVSLLFTEG